MATLNILELVRSGDVQVEWAELTSEYNGHKLVLSVMRDAMRFNNVPAMTWDRKIISAKRFNGVRLAATAKELQEIADLLFGMLLTPKVCDLVWAEAGRSGTQLESVVSVKGRIVAVSHVHDVHEALEAALRKAGGDVGGFIESVGKYWVISNRLIGGKFGVNQAVNYAWFTRQRGNGLGVTKTANVWQTVGAAHNALHQDPSQAIRLMHRLARLLRAGSTEYEDVDLYDIAKDPELAGLISHEGVLQTTRMLNVPEPRPIALADGTTQMPDILIIG